MLVVPYSTALKLAQPQVVTYIVSILCVLVFVSGLNQAFWYEPTSWNPVAMISSSLAHADWSHLLGNLVFFLAFAPALEVLIGSKLRYIWIMVFISLVVGVSYSVSIVVGDAEPLPTLGLSGVVTGMIGLSAFLMPQARIRVFGWFIVFWKIFYVPAWVLAIIYIGLDTWEMVSADDYHGINVVAHVSGGVAGYLYGFFWLKERREDTREELEQEIEVMKVEQKHGKTRSEAFRSKVASEQRQIEVQQTRDFDKFMGKVYQCVKTHRDGEAINLLLSKYGLDTPVKELEDLFKRVEEWGPSRTQLCLGRLIIHLLDQDKRHGRAFAYIEKCQSVSTQFVLADLSKTLFYARFAIEAGKLDVGKNMVVDCEKRYGTMVNSDQCREFHHYILKNQVG